MQVSPLFIDMASRGPMGEKFHIIALADMDTVRDQNNSVVCLNRATLPKGAAYTEVTKDVTAALPEHAHVPVAGGDILAIATESASGEKYVSASFHGDTIL